MRGMRDKFINFIKEATNEYYDIFLDKEETFAKRNFVLPANTINMIDEWCYGIKNFKMGKSIFIRACIAMYKDYLMSVYQANPNSDFQREQLAVSLSPEAMEDLNTIRRITGQRANVTIIKQAIDHCLKYCPIVDEENVVNTCEDSQFVDVILGQTAP